MLDRWTCGHVAGAMCAECHRQLAARAAELVAGNEKMREAVIAALGEVIPTLQLLRRQTADPNADLDANRDQALFASGLALGAMERVVEMLRAEQRH